MNNLNFLKKLKTDIDNYEQSRLKLIQSSSGNIKLAKKTIFELHRDNYELAKQNLEYIEKNYIQLEKDLIKKLPNLRYEGALKAALEEYAEAKIFYQFLTEKKITQIKEIKLGYSEYIGGLCDFTGELVRKATLMTIKGEYKAVKEYYEVVRDIMAELIEFNLSSYLRTKADQMKRNMKKMEEIMYDIEVKMGKK